MIAMQAYRRDLAYIHDVGFSDYALKSAPGLLQILKKNNIKSGLVVDLGCGSGRWAAALNVAGYRAFGVDQSAAMIDLARRIAPRSRFQVGSLLRIGLPECDAITAVGECLNYCFDKSNSRTVLQDLFQRVYEALRPGGVFVFDIAEPNRIPPRLPKRVRASGADWAILVSIDGDRKLERLRRQIVCFRKVGKRVRRSRETHMLQLYRSEDLVADLRASGFRARKARAYGRYRLPSGISAIIAVKPESSGKSRRAPR